MKKLILSSIVTGLAFTGGTAFAQNLVTNGSFEQSGYSSPQQFWKKNPFLVDGWTTTGSGGNAVGGWMNSATATTQGVASVPGPGAVIYTLPTSFDNVATVAGNTLVPGASQTDPDGGYFLTLDGGHETAIMQTITGLTVGETATLSFYWGAVQVQQWVGPITEQLQVSLGDQTLSTQILSEPTHNFSGWIKETFTFVPTSTSEVLKFVSLGTPAGVPPNAVLDGISLTQVPPPPVSAVPEPSVYGLMLGGLGIVAFVHRRRRGAQNRF